MRNLFYTILVLLTVYACAGKREIVTEQKQVLPAVEDVVMYEINPRVFALKLMSYQNILILFSFWVLMLFGLCQSMRLVR